MICVEPSITSTTDLRNEAGIKAVAELSKGRQLIAEKRDAISGRLRQQRLVYGISVRALAARVGVSPSLLSQIETGRATPSIGTLYALVRELNLSLDELFTQNGKGDESKAATVEATVNLSPMPLEEVPTESFSLPTTVPVAPIPLTAATAMQGPVYRVGTRRVIAVNSGVIWERLAGTTNPSVDFISLTFEPSPDGPSDPVFLEHVGREYGLVLSGTLHVDLRFDHHVLDPGDSITFDSTVPHRLWTPGPGPARAIWVTVGHTP